MSLKSLEPVSDGVRLKPLRISVDNPYPGRHVQVGVFLLSSQIRLPPRGRGGLKEESRVCAWKHGLHYVQQKDALSSDGCPICTLLVAGMRKHLFWFLYQNVNDVFSRKRLLESKGFCKTHAWQLYQIERDEWSDSLDVAILYGDQIRDAVRTLDGLKRTLPSLKPKRGFLHNLLKSKSLSPFCPKEECPACEYQHEMESNRIGSFIQSLGEADFQERYQASFGLCIPHFWKALEATDDENLKVFLMNVQRAKLERLSVLLEEYIRKHDYRFANEPKGEESRSPRWAIEMMVGKPSQK